MADVQPPATEQPKPFDAKAYMDRANATEEAVKAGKPIPEQPKPVEVARPAVVAKDDDEDDADKRVSRSDRRRLKQHIELAEERGKRIALEALIEKGLVTKPAESAATTDEDPEPKRAAFTTDAEYNRALGRWDARQEAKKVVGKEVESVNEKEQRELQQAHWRAMDAKCKKDIEGLKDWDEVTKAIVDDPDVVDWFPDEHEVLIGLLSDSDVKAYILYHFAKNQKELGEMLALTKTPNAQIRAFHRLEGRIEKLYTPEQSDKAATAAQAVEETPKDRRHPAEASAGRNSASELDAGKPRPSTEVAARGGSPTPEAPKPGTALWMEQENARQFARR